MGVESTPVSSYGPYGMQAVVDIPISGFSGCPGPNRGNIYLPAASSSHPNPAPGPIITFAHGNGQGGAATDLVHRESLFKHLVAMGFVVVAGQTGGLSGYCDNSHDQLRMLSWARTSTYASRIDFKRAVLMGFSMGGRATLKNAGDPTVVSANNVVAAATFMPDCHYGCKTPVVPVHFFAGRLDATAPWATTREVYRAAKVDKVFAVLAGQGHEPTSTQWSALITPRVATWLQCKVLGRQHSCALAFDSFPSCRYGCRHCGCGACARCLPCLEEGSCNATGCGECAPCRTCGQCSRCSGGSTA